MTCCAGAENSPMSLLIPVKRLNPPDHELSRLLARSDIVGFGLEEAGAGAGAGNGSISDNEIDSGLGDDCDSGVGVGVGCEDCLGLMTLD